MPELPEVETVRIGLEKLIIGKTIARVDFDNAKSFPNSDLDVENFLIGAKVHAVRRRAKVLLIDLTSGYTLMTHLKMTGQLVFVGTERFGAGHPNESLVSTLPDKSTRVKIGFSDKTNLYFNDQRKFGWMKLLPTETLHKEPFLEKVGPEPLEYEFNERVFYERLQKRKGSTIKAAILDQTVLAGVGNIYADESLWGAKIHPARRVATITKDDITALCNEIKYVLQLSIDKGGSTDRNYVNAEGKKGSYIEIARVFRREGQACPRCGALIEKTRVAGRGTHICPVCQRMNK